MKAPHVLFELRRFVLCRHLVQARSGGPILAFDFVLGQAADTRMGTAGVGDDDRDRDLVGAWSVRHTYFHAVEMAAHASGILVAERHVEGCAGGSALFGGGDKSRAAAKYIAKRCAKLGV